MKTLTGADERRRVQIYRRGDGRFSFDVERCTKGWNGEPSWVPVPWWVSIYDSAETAEREARACIAWLNE